MKDLINRTINLDSVSNFLQPNFIHNSRKIVNKITMTEFQAWTMNIIINIIMNSIKTLYSNNNNNNSSIKLLKEAQVLESLILIQNIITLNKFKLKVNYINL